MKALLVLAAVISLSTSPPAQAADGQFAVLVLAVPNKWHYEYVPIARDSFEKMAKLHGVELSFTSRLGAFEADLGKYAAVVLLNDPHEGYTDAQRAGLERYMKAGGNAVIVHSAIVSKPGDWPWYEKLVGRSFTIHPMVQTATVTKADTSHPATFGLPDRWIWSDEWYEFSNPHGVKINPILTADERTYDPTKMWPGQIAKGMGANHPVSWWHAYEKGRVFVTALGHNGEMYRDKQYLDHLWAGVWWAATGRGQQPR